LINNLTTLLFNLKINYPCLCISHCIYQILYCTLYLYIFYFIHNKISFIEHVHFSIITRSLIDDCLMTTCYSRFLASLLINYLIGNWYTYLGASDAIGTILCTIYIYIYTLEVLEISRHIKSNRPAGSFCFTTNRFRIFFFYSSRFTFFTVWYTLCNDTKLTQQVRRCRFITLTKS